MGNDASSPVGGKTHKHERFAMKKWLISFLLREHKKRGNVMEVRGHRSHHQVHGHTGS